jgi:two-component system nitrate/nitrite response regulator NarL
MNTISPPISLPGNSARTGIEDSRLRSRGAGGQGLSGNLPYRESGAAPISKMLREKSQNGKPRAKILIADSEGVFRLGLKKLFSVEDELRVVAQAEDTAQLLAMARSFQPDLALAQQQIVLNGHSGVLGRMGRYCPRCKVVVVASLLTDEEREELLLGGVSGVIPRSAQPEIFVENVRNVLKGSSLQPLRPKNGQGRAARLRGGRARPVDTLTPREKTIISCLTQGWRNRDIAKHLTITEQTVKNHLRSIYDKVGVSDRLELVLYAIHQRLELPPVNSYG